MKIACVAPTPALREKLVAQIETAYQELRSSIGFSELIDPYACSTEELAVGTSPDIILLGLIEEFAELYALAREIRTDLPTTPIICQLSQPQFELKNLRRLRPFCADTISNNDAPIRIVDTLSRHGAVLRQAALGHVITVSGVKGGVGATSVVSALAEGFVKQSARVCLLDLSRAGALSIYLQASRRQSPAFTEALTELDTPSAVQLSRWLVPTSCDVQILPPPSGSADIRELWLRDESRLDVTLGIVDRLRELFNIVIVDMGAAEGLVPFGLRTVAKARLLVASNEPASIHLLANEIAPEADIPGDGTFYTLINSINPNGLQQKDIEAFLSLNANFQLNCLLGNLPFDPRAGAWIGTGNTFLAEGKKPLRTALLNVVKKLDRELTLLPKQLAPARQGIEFNAYEQLPLKEKRPRRLLPWLGNDSSEQTLQVMAPKQDPKGNKMEHVSTNGAAAAAMPRTTTYQPPQLIGE